MGNVPKPHLQVPVDPEAGDTFQCPCGCTYEFVVLDDGEPGEWVATS
jgi:hypothetical protein